MPRAVITFHDVEQGSPEWLEAREGMYTGSNADKLLNGIGDLEYAKARESSFGGNFWTKRGHLLESQAVKLYEKKNGVVVVTTGYVTNSLYPGCLYSPDGLPTDIVLEVKCFSKDKHLELYNAKSVLNLPTKIVAQIHYGMLITGRRKAILLIFNPMFAKKYFEDENGVKTENPDYDPIKAYKEIVIRYDKDIADNFKRKITGVPV
ncbi:MAG: YqaJ viral recombinase family protein [Flavobacteriales bacterium]|nr:YqaJ viral recombinase family protein [Flavobacteriales bacterium]